MRVLRGMLAVACSAGALSWSGAGWARPQANVGVLPGVCGAFQESAGPVCFHGAVSADVMFGRDSARSWGIGPALQLATAGFDDVRLHVGGSLQVPLADLQLVVSPLPYYRFAPDAEFGAGLRAFIGSRSYNYTADYVAAFGLEAGLDWGFGAARERQVVIAAHLDGMWMAVPIIALVSWLRCCDE